MTSKLSFFRGNHGFRTKKDTILSKRYVSSSNTSCLRTLEFGRTKWEDTTWDKCQESWMKICSSQSTILELVSLRPNITQTGWNRISVSFPTTTFKNFILQNLLNNLINTDKSFFWRLLRMQQSPSRTNLCGLFFKKLISSKLKITSKFRELVKTKVELRKAMSTLRKLFSKNSIKRSINSSN